MLNRMRRLSSTCTDEQNTAILPHNLETSCILYWLDTWLAYKRISLYNFVKLLRCSCQSKQELCPQNDPLIICKSSGSSDKKVSKISNQICSATELNVLLCAFASEVTLACAVAVLCFRNWKKEMCFHLWIPLEISQLNVAMQVDCVEEILKVNLTA